MQTRETQVNRDRRTAFTLVELMVVVAIISILIGGVFRLLSAVGEKNKEAVTATRMERLQNALSGYYAVYGAYPPVMQFESPDPEQRRDPEDRTKIEKDPDGFTWQSSNRAAHSQSLAYEFPTVKGLDDYIEHVFEGKAKSAGKAFPINMEKTSDSWYQIQLFKYGLLSYLLPRAHLAWGTEDRYEDLFKSPQWTRTVPAEGIGKLVKTQLADENNTVARWLPNFEKIVCGGETVMGVNINEPQTGVMFSNIYTPANGGVPYVVQKMTVRDGWNNELYYYSAAPYQSYRLWSSGKDGKTFPPWIPLDKFEKKYAEQAATWIEDDIVRFDR